MKKIKVEGKLNLNKTTVSKLSNEQMSEIHGGQGVLSIGKNCTQPCYCDIEKWSKSLFCRDK